VVRAAAESAIPLISAVGHETDTTLIDYAADRRAPTPTAAAEMAVPVRLDLLNWLRQQDGYMTRAARQGVAARQQRLGDLSRGLPRPEALASRRGCGPPSCAIAARRSGTAWQTSRGGATGPAGWDDTAAGCPCSLERLHSTLGYEATLRRGYAVVHADDHVATTVAAAEGATRLEIEFADGKLPVNVTERPSRPAPRRKAHSDTPPDQGSLF
jgi:exodeoxyribonuclease VII large subunit